MMEISNKESRLRRIEQALQGLFDEQIEFDLGSPMPDLLLKQFVFFFYQLENLYFNSNHVTKLGKFYVGLESFNNAVAKKYFKTLTSLRKIREPNYVPEKRLTEFMISSYDFLVSLIAEAPSKTQQTICLNNRIPVDSYNADFEYFKPILSLHAELNAKPVPLPVQGILLTNSLITLDYQKGYSDADMIVLIGEEAYQSPAKLREVRLFLTKKSRYLYLFDPLQHHGFFVFGPTVRRYYPQAIFPTLLYEYAANMIELDIVVDYCFQDDSFERKLLLKRSLESLLRFVRADDSHFHNIYNLKSFVSQLTLFPVLLSQSKGTYIYKRDAFEQRCQNFDRPDVFQLAECIRERFPYRRLFSSWIPWAHPSLIPKIHGHLLLPYARRLVPELKKMALGLLEDTVQELSLAKD
jgi:hypothetical protein